MIARVLTIAGSDSGGGAGVQADLKTFSVFRTYGSSVITALTAQNTVGVSAVHVVPVEIVRAQLEAVLSDIGADAVKTGMLATAGIVVEVARALRDYKVENVVVDPVMVSQSGATLLDEDARDALLRELLPLATILTPNLPEAAALTGAKVESVTEARAAAIELVRLGAGAALVKGGHRERGDAVDVFHDGKMVHKLRATRIATIHTHGTGCQLSAAIAAGLAQHRSLGRAVADAKRFISAAIQHSLPLGRGNGPANPLAWLDETH